MIECYLARRTWTSNAHNAFLSQQKPFASAHALCGTYDFMPSNVAIQHCTLSHTLAAVYESRSTASALVMHALSAM